MDEQTLKMLTTITAEIRGWRQDTKEDFAKVNNRLDKIEGRLDALEVRATAIEKGLQDVKYEIKFLREDTYQLRMTDARLETRIEDLERPAA